MTIFLLDQSSVFNVRKKKKRKKEKKKRICVNIYICKLLKKMQQKYFEI